VRPQPGPVRSGSARLPTIRGPLTLSFAQTAPGGPGGCFELSLHTPGGTRARVFLPRWGANVTLKVDGEIASAVNDGDYARVDGILPGAHSFTTC